MKTVKFSTLLTSLIFSSIAWSANHSSNLVFTVEKTRANGRVYTELWTYDSNGRPIPGIWGAHELRLDIPGKVRKISQDLATRKILLLAERPSNSNPTGFETVIYKVLTPYRNSTEYDWPPEELPILLKTRQGRHIIDFWFDRSTGAIVTLEHDYTNTNNDVYAFKKQTRTLKWGPVLVGSANHSPSQPGFKHPLFKMAVDSATGRVFITDENGQLIILNHDLSSNAAFVISGASSANPVINFESLYFNSRSPHYNPSTPNSGAPLMGIYKELDLATNTQMRVFGYLDLNGSKGQVLANNGNTPDHFTIDQQGNAYTMESIQVAGNPSMNLNHIDLATGTYTQIVAPANVPNRIKTAHNFSWVTQAYKFHTTYAPQAAAPSSLSKHVFVGVNNVLASYTPLGGQNVVALDEFFALSDRGEIHGNWYFYDPSFSQWFGVALDLNSPISAIYKAPGSVPGQTHPNSFNFNQVSIPQVLNGTQLFGQWYYVNSIGAGQLRASNIISFTVGYPIVD